MSKKVLIISGTPRKGGNSELLCEEFAKGARESGNEVELIRLREKKVGYCTGCYYCTEHGGECRIADDAPGIVDRIIAADVIVLSSPVYFYSVDAQIKAMIDRTVCRWTDVKDKEFYYIATAAEDSDDVMTTAMECFRGYARCVDGSSEKGIIEAKGVFDLGDVEGTPYMTQAYEMGKGVR